DTPGAQGTGELPALMHDLADRVGAIFTDQFRRAGYDAQAAPIYAHALVGMVAFVGQWWTESRRPPPVASVAAHIAALAWMGLRHLPKRPELIDPSPLGAAAPAAGKRRGRRPAPPRPSQRPRRPRNPARALAPREAGTPNGI